MNTEFSFESRAEKKNYVERMFSQIAGRYDFFNHFLSLGFDYAWRRRAIEILREHLNSPSYEAKPFNSPSYEAERSRRGQASPTMRGGGPVGEAKNFHTFHHTTPQPPPLAEEG